MKKTKEKIKDNSVDTPINLYTDALREMIPERVAQLRHCFDVVNLRMKSAPEGTLSVNMKGGNVQYYHRTNANDLRGSYIKKCEYELIQMLAQKEYDKKILKELQKEILALENCYRKYDSEELSRIYASIHSGKRSLVNPIYLPEDELLIKWQSVVYDKLPFSPGSDEHYTDAGERVRSKSEILIANKLRSMGVPYHYEYPIWLSEKGAKTKKSIFDGNYVGQVLIPKEQEMNYLNPDLIKVHPDFYCLNMRTRKVFVWEHFGRMSDLDYANKTTRKIRLYEKNGFWQGENMIMTFETAAVPLNVQLVEKMITKYLL